MIGWCADFLRLLWGLLYWNTRKAWFRLQGAAGLPPCQVPSDSGRARETQCEACLHWQRPSRFRRVCPLLVETDQGLRCAADAADVRPFWGRVAAWYGGLAFALYLAGVLAVFTFLRTVGYPVSVVDVALPPLWHRVAEARGSFFLQKAQAAFDQGRTSEGLLYLANAYDFDPSNYTTGIALAKRLQIGHPARSNSVYARLLRDHPDKRATTAQEWFRALLARGDFTRIATLARDEVLASSPHSAVWMRGLVFAVRRGAPVDILRAFASNPSPAARPWLRLVEVELLLRDGQRREARAALETTWPAEAPAFCLFYRVITLVELRETLAAIDLLGRNPGVLDAEAEVTLRLEAFAAAGDQRLLNQEFERLLSHPITPASLAIVKVACAHLIRHPDRAAFDRLHAKLGREKMPFDLNSAGAWFSLFCAAGAVNDHPKLRELTNFLLTASNPPFTALGGIEAFFLGESGGRRITTVLPFLPLPIEIAYALLERYLPPAAPSAPAVAPP